MANYIDTYYDEVDALLDKLRVDPFSGSSLDPVPQETVIPLGPVGWVENADAESGEANVIIDATGITILNGKLFLQDYGGNSVVGPAGFDGSWVEFVNGGVYNGGFNGGITSWTIVGVTGTGAVVTGVSIVGTAETAADYLASLSSAIPYWASAVYDADLTSQIRADSTYGRYLAVERPTNGLGGNAPGGTVEFMQDVPVVQGLPYEMFINYEMIAGGAPLVNSEIHVFRAWHDSDHDDLSIRAEIGAGYYTPGISVDPSGAYTFDAGIPPVGAKYARVWLQFVHAANATGGGAVWQMYDVRLRPTLTGARFLLDSGGSVFINPVIFDQPSQGSLRITIPETAAGWGNFEIWNGGDSNVSVAIDAPANGGRISFGSGSGSVDVKLARTAANTLALDTGDKFDKYLRFVPIAETTVVSGTTVVSIGTTLSAAITGVPTTALFVQVQCRATSTGTVGNANIVGVRHQAGGNALYIHAMPSLGYFNENAGVVDLQAGTGKINYFVDRGVGTVGYLITCTGYYTDVV